MHLAIDVGNTRIKLAVFKGKQLLAKVLFEQWNTKEIVDFAYNHSVEKIILSSVRLVEEKHILALKQHADCLVLDHNTPIPITNMYGTPETLGKDRLAAVVGAYYEYKAQNCLVIDAGTCITFDLLTAQGMYLGGNIAPGVQMRLQAMHQFTAKLPLIQRGQQSQFWGISTETAMRNGGQYGAVYEMEGFISHCKQKFGQLTTVITGGDADFFAKQLKTKIFVRPNLVLTGLIEILNYNI